MLHFLAGILLVLASGTANIALADDRIVGRAYFEDKSAQLNFAQVQTQQFTPYTGVLSKGFSDSAFWIRLRIAPDTSRFDDSVGDGNKLILRIRPTYLDEIALFDPLQTAAKSRLTGDRYSWERNEYRSLNYNFVIPRGDAPRDVWLRLKTTSMNLIHVEALSLDDLLKADREQELMYSVYLVLSLFFLSWAIIHWISMRERVIGLFIFKSTLGILFALAFIGYFRVFFSGVASALWLDDATSLLLICYVAASLMFDYYLLREFSPPKWGMRLLLLLLVVLLPVEIALMLSGETKFALLINMIVILIKPFVTWLLAIMAGVWEKVDGKPAPLISRRTLILIFSVNMLAVLLIFPVFGLIKDINFVLYGFLAYGLFHGIIMVVMLHFRARRLEQRRQMAITQLAVSEKQAGEERHQRLEQSKFLSMLTHELKTPLAVVRMVLGSQSQTPELLAYADRAVRDMNDVIERCLQAEQLSDLAFTVNKTDCPLLDEIKVMQSNSQAPERLVICAEISPVLQLDAQVLRIVLANLIDNASKYSPPESRIDIGVEALNQNGVPGIAVTVQNLPGVAGWPDPEMIFQKYYRSKRAHEQTGSGIGLYLVKNMAHLLGGEVSYLPDDNYIRFKLWLPV